MLKQPEDLIENRLSKNCWSAVITAKKNLSKHSKLSNYCNNKNIFNKLGDIFFRAIAKSIDIFIYIYLFTFLKGIVYR